MYRFKLLLLLIAVNTCVLAQRGKDGDYTVTSLNEVVNTFTTLTANAANTATSITVANNTLTGSAFSGALQPGDLIIIYQVQGVWVDISTYAVDNWGAVQTFQNSYLGSGSVSNYIEFGAINNYREVGKYEYAEVLSVSGSNTIQLTCPIKNSYLTGDNYRVQIVRVPRFKNLTVPTGTSISTQEWDGTTGGILALEIEEDLDIDGTGRISADETGFRGGNPVNNGNAAPVSGSISNVNDRGYLGSPDPAQGSEKGESIFGNFVDYNVLSSRYGYGSIANGGGGGGYHNAGGGGGSNVGVGAYYGYGIVDRGPGNVYDPAWILENPIMHTTPSSGGGRGGYTHAEDNNNPLTVGPHNDLWGSDYRRISGGVGGHPLAYDQTRAFFGGGGGAGHGNDLFAGSGGAGGGIVFLSVYGNVTGNGIISSNGEDGENAEGPNATGSQKTGDDGAGGAGGGGAVIINNINALPATLQLEAIGGDGGDQILKRGPFNANNQADGPGGGGAGGMIAFSAGTPSQDVIGGIAGTTNSDFMTDFPVNGATGGASGIDNRITYTLDVLVENDTICSGETSTLTATKVGNLSPSPTLFWYNSYTGGTSLASGNSFTTPTLTTTTTYYVGRCPLSFRVPVTVVVSPDIVLTGIPPTIAPETCTGNDGSITGISASGGTGVLTYEWNGNTTASEDLTGATAGNYTLIVTDEVGCTASEGPFTINNVGGPIVDVTSISITNESCVGNDGSITGITVSGGLTPYTYTWNGNTSVNTDLSGVSSGSYTLVVTDANFCSTTVGPFTITSASSIIIDESGMAITDESCNGNDGNITGITASGGTGTLTYAWSPSGINTLDLTGVTNGSYTLTITDGSGCSTTSGPHVINQTAGPTVDVTSVVVEDATCGNNNGSITGITATGTGLTYAWSPSGATTIDVTGLSSGAQTLVITDGAGCTASAGPYTISSAPSPVLDASGIVITDETCNGNDGGITGITVTGGTVPLTYDWNGNASPTTDLTSAVGGTYTLTVTDGNGCTDNVGPFTIVASPGPAIDVTGISITDESCIGNDGSITGITVSGGLAPYTYAWNGNTSVNTDLSGVSSGTYSIVVTDANLCSTTAGPFTISSASSIVIDESGMTITDESCSGNDGSITGITASGGTGTLTYAWSPLGVNTLDLTGVTNGSYTLTITDGSGCSATSGPHVINQTAGPTIDASSVVVTDASCGNNNGSITGITASGGTGTLTYAWSPSGVNTLDLTGVTNGSYTLTITDGSGCSTTSGPHVINQIGAPTVDDVNKVLTPASCGLNNGSISGITVTGTGLSYAWSPSGATTLDANNLAAGTHTLIITDGAGCTATAGPYTITATPSLVLDASGATIINETCNGNDGSITGITLTGGTAPLTYDWNGTASSTADLTGVMGGTYTLTVTDANGCISTAGPFTISNPIIPTVDITTSDQFINAGESVNINTTFTPVSSTLSWSPTEYLDCINCPNPIANPIESTVYVVTATSADGCVSQDSILINIEEPCGKIQLPTVFSPNGDGLNDQFCVIGNCVFSMRFQVFNRWGEKIFESIDLNNCWDGTFKGELVNTGVYVYKLTGVKNDGSKFQESGNVNLLR